MYYGTTAGRLLQLLLKTYSPTFHEGEAVSLLVEEAWRLGFDEAYIDQAGNGRLLVYPRDEGSEQARIALVGHIDTVPGWVEPLSNGDIIRGRGAVDAKAPLASMIIGALHARPRRHVVEVVAAVGEEGPSHGAWFLVKSGWRAKAIIIGEPTNTTKVAIGYRGGCRIKVACTGEEGHSSSPWLYQDACSLALEAYKKLAESSSVSVNGYTFTVTGIRCGDINDTNSNVVAGEAVLNIDARIPVGGGVEELREKLYSMLPSSCSATIARCIQPVRVSVSSPVPRALIRSLLGYGIRPQPVIKAGTSDMNILRLVTSNIAAYGPGRSELSHTRYEEVSLQELDTAVHVYVQAIRELDLTL
ncbi:MAG: hypothetical protein DSY37_05110 [Hyperthermus sp.]|nr:MAG: hypothetical protein DSY37_05110 [Hyperthermus sp.]